MIKNSYIIFSILVIGCGAGGGGEISNDENCVIVNEVLICNGVPVDSPDASDGANGLNGTDGVNGSDGEDAVTGGTRLEPYYYVGDDGSKYYTGQYYDTLLETSCAVSSNGVNGISDYYDGSIRCVPSCSVYISVGQFFANASCTQNLGYNVLSQSQVCNWAAGALNTRYGVFKILTQYSGTLYQKQTISGGTACVEINRSSIPSIITYNVGEVLPPETFVEFTLEH